MGGLMSRNKGKRGEREVIALLQPIVDEVLGEGVVYLQRNLNQSDRGGADAAGLDWLSLEIKRQQNENVSGWWRQTLSQCQDGQLPVLVYRANHRPWNVKTLMYVADSLVEVTMDMDNFVTYFRHCLREL